jgi:signal peptidase II
LRARVPLRQYGLFLLVALLGCAADLSTKAWVFHWRGLPGERGIVWLIEGYVGIETSLNRGALFGMGEGGSRYFAVFSVVALAGVLVWLVALRAAEDRLLTISLGCISGGILGNLYDRLGLWSTQPLPPVFQDKGFETAVRDWILICWNYKQLTWPNFNIADSLLVCGAGLLLFHAFFPRHGGRGTKKTNGLQTR